MRTRPILAPLTAALFFAFNAAAQDHSQHSMDMPMSMPMPMPEQEHAQPTGPVPQGHARHHAAPESRPKTESSMPAMPDHAAMQHPTSPSADQPRTPIPVLTDADRAAAMPPPDDHPVHDNSRHSFVLINRLEGFDTNAGRGAEWEAQAWVGTDRNKLWLRSEGERVGRSTESSDLEVLYGRAMARWWDVVAGVRHDFTPGGSQDFVAIGVKGLAPYKFEIAATAYIGQSGHTAAQLEAEYETLLTNRLILQSLIEANVHGSDDPGRGIESGLSTVEAGWRLRYEFTRQIAPYVGLVHERAFGGTADRRRADGEDVHDTRAVAGVRIWF